MSPCQGSQQILERFRRGGKLLRRYMSCGSISYVTVAEAPVSALRQAVGPGGGKMHHRQSARGHPVCIFACVSALQRPQQSPFVSPRLHPAFWRSVLGRLPSFLCPELLVRSGCIKGLRWAWPDVSGSAPLSQQWLRSVDPEAWALMKRRQTRVMQIVSFLVWLGSLEIRFSTPKQTRCVVIVCCKFRSHQGPCFNLLAGPACLVAHVCA